MALVIATGCASSAQMPADFDVADATVVADATEPALVIDGPSGKGSGAVAGAATGGGAGFLIGGLACLGAGPLAPLCLGLVVPTGMAVGAVSGAVVGAVRADSAANVDSKRVLLATLMTPSTAGVPVVARLQQQLREALVLSRPLGEIKAADARGGWTLRLTLTELATVGGGPGAPYALQASARLDASQVAGAQPIFVKHYRAISAQTLTTAEWGANEARQAQEGLDGMAAALVTQMIEDLIR